MKNLMPGTKLLSAAGVAMLMTIEAANAGPSTDTYSATAKIHLPKACCAIKGPNGSVSYKYIYELTCLSQGHTIVKIVACFPRPDRRYLPRKELFLDPGPLRERLLQERQRRLQELQEAQRAKRQ